MVKIGFQGDVGSNAEEATGRFIDEFKLENADQIPLITSKNVVSALIEQKIDYGVMATRNSIAGEVTETKEALNNDIEMLEETQIPIHHCVFTKSKDVSKITSIASHIQALRQTRNTRKKIMPKAQEVECIDTALAAKMLCNGEYPSNYAVICRKNAGERYGLNLFAENIEDDKSNKTTFGLFMLKKQKSK